MTIGLIPEYHANRLLHLDMIADKLEKYPEKIGGSPFANEYVGIVIDCLNPNGWVISYSNTQREGFELVDYSCQKSANELLERLNEKVKILRIEKPIYWESM